MDYKIKGGENIVVRGKRMYKVKEVYSILQGYEIVYYS